MNNNIIAVSRKGRTQHSKMLLFFAILTISLILIITVLSSKIILANTRTSTDSYKYFKSIEVEEGDTLWSIACEYTTSGHYDSLNDYINEIKSINGISDDTIKSGQHLIIAYYSNEYK